MHTLLLSMHTWHSYYNYKNEVDFNCLIHQQLQKRSIQKTNLNITERNSIFIQSEGARSVSFLCDFIMDIIFRSNNWQLEFETKNI